MNAVESQTKSKFEHSDLILALGSEYTNNLLEPLRGFAYCHATCFEELARQSLPEHWGNDNHVLRGYTATHVSWAIRQGQYSRSDTQFYVCAGHLQTRYGTPLYLVFEENQKRECQPFFLKAVGADVSAPELPAPPSIPAPQDIPVGAEVVMMHDHILTDHPERVPFLRSTPRVAQMCAIAGAVQWSLNRALQFPYWYFGRMQYLVPLYLSTREDITQAPDAIAPVQVNNGTLLVRTVLEPHMPYAKARVAATRHDKLPAWLLRAWAEYAQSATEADSSDIDG